MNHIQIIENLRVWFVKNQYKGTDPYQIDQKASGLLKKLPFLKYVRKALKPFHVFIPKSAFSSFPKIYHPKAIGLIIGGNAFLYSISKNQELLIENNYLINLLKELRNKDYKHHAWGSPFEWGSNPRYPANTPAICLLSPIGNALLDYYEIAKDKKVLELCNDVALHITEENGYKEIDKDTACLYYSPVDKNEVYNSNALAANFLFRLNAHMPNKEQIHLAKRVCNYVMQGQRSDGSWVYSNSSDIIDNRHTGYILESLVTIKKHWQNEKLEEAYSKGLKYYKTYLTDKGLPKWSPQKTFPIDIHDVAQAIITYTETGDLDRAEYIANYAIQNMSNGKDEFYFKLFNNGNVNKNVFIRWGQAWMYYALGKMFYNVKKSN